MNQNLITLDEIAIQIADSDIKLIFGLAKMSEVLTKAVKLSGKNVKLVYVKSSPQDQIPADGVIFDDLLDSRGTQFI